MDTAGNAFQIIGSTHRRYVFSAHSHARNVIHKVCALNATGDTTSHHQMRASNVMTQIAPYARPSTSVLNATPYIILPQITRARHANLGASPVHQHHSAHSVPHIIIPTLFI